MRAAVLDRADHLVVEDVTPLPPGPRDVVVRLEASGVCHSDLTIVRNLAPGAPPTIMGHEGVGIVEDVGAEVRALRRGDRVIGAFVPVCGTCWFCVHDQPYLCAGVGQGRTPRATSNAGTTVAFSGLGTFAEAMTCHEASLVKVDSDLPAEQLALIGCGVTTGVGAVLNAASVRPGTTVAVVGCGGVGQAVVQGARIASAATIVAVDPVAAKRETARALGATHTIDPGEADPVEALRALTDGRGVDYAFEVIGRTETVLQAFAATRRGGTTVVVGMPGTNEPIPIPGRDAFLAVRRIVWTMYGSTDVRVDFPHLIALAESGRLELGAMVSRRIGLDDVNDAFRAMEAGEVIRSVIV